MKLRPALLGAAFLGVVLMVAACASPPTPLDDAKATATIGEPDRYYVAGDDIRLGLSLFNPGDRDVVLGDELTGGSRLELRDASGKLFPPRSRGRAAPTEPQVIEAGGRARVELDAQHLFPALNQAGDYRLTVVYSRFRSNTVALHVLPAFQPTHDYRARLVTDRGKIELRLFPDVAPLHVENFVNLARSGFYNSILFHRIVPRSIIQAGDPTRSGRGGPGHTVRGEFSDLPHERGTLSMARSGTDPNSAGSQWFICLERLEELDGMYTIFGEVVAGLDVADAISRVKVERDVPKDAVLIERIVITELTATPPAAEAES